MLDIFDYSRQHCSDWGHEVVDTTSITWVNWICNSDRSQAGNEHKIFAFSWNVSNLWFHILFCLRKWQPTISIPLLRCFSDPAAPIIQQYFGHCTMPVKVPVLGHGLGDDMLTCNLWGVTFLNQFPMFSSMVRNADNVRYGFKPTRCTEHNGLCQWALQAVILVQTCCQFFARTQWKNNWTIRFVFFGILFCVQSANFWDWMQPRLHSCFAHSSLFGWHAVDMPLTCTTDMIWHGKFVQFFIRPLNMCT